MRKEKLDVQEIRIRLHQELPRLRQEYAVRSLGLFGSYVRGENRKGSDLDVLVEFFQFQGCCGFLTSSVISRPFSVLALIWCRKKPSNLPLASEY
jgi:hypothetical protein